MDPSNAGKAFDKIWQQAMGDTSHKHFTSRGGRFGAVMHIAEAAPQAQR